MSREAFESRLAALPAHAHVRLWALLDYVREAIDDAVDAAGVDALVAYAHDLYDKHIAPIDVPWVPNADEPEVIDKPAKWLIAQAIHGAHNAIHTEG